MKFSFYPILFLILALNSLMAEPTPPATNTAPTTNAPPAEPAMPQPSVIPSFKLSDYLKDLTDTLKLSDPVPGKVRDLYLNDSKLVQNALIDSANTAYGKEQALEGLRQARNARILVLLTPEQQAEFLTVEDKYRVKMIKLALAQGWDEPAPAPVSAPAPAAAPAKPAKS